MRPAQAELTEHRDRHGDGRLHGPEQALNTKTADARADIYSLGCSLFYLLTGKATYDGDTLMAKLLAHRDQPIPSIASSSARSAGTGRSRLQQDGRQEGRGPLPDDDAK